MRRFGALLLLLLLGCSDPAEPRVQRTLDPLFGTWEFLRSCGGMTPQCFEGSSIAHLEFSPPDSVIARSNGDIVWAHRARLEMDATTPYGPYPSIEVHDEEGGWAPLYTVLHLSADSLELGDNAADGFTLHFRRLSD